MASRWSGRIVFRNPKLSEQTRRTYTDRVKDYYRFLDETGSFMGIESVKQWLRPMKAGTHNLSYDAIKEFLLKAYEREAPARRFELEQSLKSIKRKRPKLEKTNIDFITKEQVETLAVEAPQRTGLIILALFWTGCRVSELINIKLENCKINGTVSILLTTTKGEKDREVFISKDLYNQIRQVFNGKYYLFETGGGKQYHRRNISKDIDFQGRCILGVDISAHTLRHSKAMYLKKRGLSPDQVAKALGHSSVITTMKYYFHGSPTAADQGIE